MGVMDAPPERVDAVFIERLGTPVRLTARRIAGEGRSDETRVLEFARDGDEFRSVVRVFRAGTVARHEVHPERLYHLLTALSATTG